MSDFQRYAIYFLPSQKSLQDFGAAWLGWDVAKGKPSAQFDIEGLADATKTPRKYGFHGTLKPPFRLVDGASEEDLKRAMQNYCTQRNKVEIAGLHIAAIGKFLALVPTQPSKELRDLAFDLVKHFDYFRKPAGENELARRRAGGLSAAQEHNLTTWGYPYVASEFRFHMTLSGKMEPQDLARLQGEAQERLPALPEPFAIETVCLVGENSAGNFHLLHRYTLSD